MQKSVAPGIIAVIIIVVVAVLAVIGWKVLGTSDKPPPTSSADQRAKYFKDHPGTENNVGKPAGGGGYQRR